MKNPTTDPDSWHFRNARLERVIDGDTVVLVLDLGFHSRRTVTIRLFGVDTAETHNTPADSPEHIRGDEHAQFVREWFADAAESGLTWPLSVVSHDAVGIYGRYAAVITRKSDGESLTVALRNEFDDV